MHKRNTKHSYSRTKRWRIVITCKCTREYFKHVLYCQKLFRPIPLQWLFWLSTRHLLLTGEIAKCFYYSEMKKENADKFSKINCLLFFWNQDKNWDYFKGNSCSLTLKFGYSEKATKFEKNLPLKIWCYSVMPNFFKWKIFSNFVAFSEYLNFTSGFLLEPGDGGRISGGGSSWYTSELNFRLLGRSKTSKPGKSTSSLLRLFSLGGLIIGALGLGSAFPLLLGFSEWFLSLIWKEFQEL